MTFGEKLTLLRLQNELSQEKLAAMLNVPRQALINWETQNDMPDIENLKRISKIFDVTIDSLVDEEEEIETKDDAFCWNIAYTLGGIGFILSFLLQDFLPNSMWGFGIGLGLLGYLLGKTYIILNKKTNK